MNRIKSRIFILTTLLLCTLFVADCNTKDCVDPVPAAKTRVTSSSEVFKRTAKDLEKEVSRMSDATCYLDNIQTSCSLVLSCLRNGWCVVELQ